MGVRGNCFSSTSRIGIIFMDLKEFKKEIKEIFKTGNGSKITEALKEYYRLKRETGQGTFKSNSNLWKK